MEFTDTPKLVTVKLKGSLAKRFGNEFKLAITSPKEAIAALSCNFPEFRSYLMELAEKGIAYRVITNHRPEGCNEAELEDACNEVTLLPVIQGSGAVGRVLLGTTLIAASLLIPFGAVGGGTSLGLLGGSLVLSGISSWLTPKPKQDKTADLKSSAFNSARGTADPNHPVPLLYGQLRIKGMPVLSSAITTVRIQPEINE